MNMWNILNSFLEQNRCPWVDELKLEIEAFSNFGQKSTNSEIPSGQIIEPFSSKALISFFVLYRQRCTRNFSSCICGSNTLTCVS